MVGGVTEEQVRTQWTQMHALWSGQLSLNRTRREARDTSQRQTRPPATAPGDGLGLGLGLGGGAAAAGQTAGMMLASLVARSLFGDQDRQGGTRAAQFMQQHQERHRAALAAAAAVVTPSAAGPGGGMSIQFFDGAGQAVPMAPRRLPPAGRGAGMFAGGGGARGRDILADMLHRSLYEYQPHHQGGGGSTLAPIDAATALASAPSSTDGAAPRCPICLEDLEAASQDDWALFPCCKQPVHLACAQRALNDNAHCPMCRALVP
jgi:hypothetical protein